ncbi:calcium-dependent kinase (macronuclear) [Tetrahymena thermophila SB210]|uniref:Calcium-dependent kinase n=1 Tax=Tetrahymena thermophila (strain SB210) TaxID=312017 RepID=Q227Q8_TETTS|nr:calcium-dependent kinase [Tetrahymena thermophila SB210]EAR81524.1 calcium-dependent kinase [Tetrahymena thermophila SB210]|eukprot:XP_001029187.1 calcium-dependent kinase [Tetrahymena thermophila SB210]
MNKISQNLVGYQEAKYKLALHLQKRKKIKELYRMKGVQMLDKPELIISDIQEPKLKPYQALIYQTMKSELSKKGYSDFRFLGQGVQGLVLLAKDSKTNMRYAIKGVQVRDPQGNLDEDLNNRVKQEVEILKKCRDSPYVVSLIDQFEGQQFSYLVLTECQGTNNTHFFFKLINQTALLKVFNAKLNAINNKELSPRFQKGTKTKD